MLVRHSVFIPALVLLAVLPLGGCRRNLLRVNTNPPGAQVFIEGRPVRNEDGNRALAKEIEQKKAKGGSLTEADFDFESNRKKFQTAPVEYEFESVNAGYSIYAQRPGYRPTYHVEFIKPRWYEYPPIDFIVDLLPFKVTDTREVTLTLEPEGQAGAPPQNGF